MKLKTCLFLIIICLWVPRNVFGNPTASNFDSGFVIGHILIDRSDVFETGTPLDHQFPYTWANKFHIISQEQFIRSQLLFKEGDPYDPEIIAESERRLRAISLFRYVSVVAKEPVNGKVDVCIQTDDVWTTSVRLSYEAAGGKNLYKVGFLEQNLFGYGVRVGAFVEQDIDRFIRGFSYKDPNFLTTPFDFFWGYGKDEKGREYEVGLENPFVSSLTRHAEGVLVNVSDDEDRLFQNGDEFANFRHRIRSVRTYASLAARPQTHRVRRWSLIHDYKKDEFFDFRFLLPVPAVQPVDRTVSAVLVGFEYGDLHFTKRQGVLTFEREEDINLGWEWAVEVGPSLEGFGSTQDGAIGQARLDKRWIFRDSLFWFMLLDAKTRYEKGKVQNGQGRVRSHFVWRSWWRENTATLTSQYRTSRNLDPEAQVLLGGENGLRGYSVRQFSGSKSLLLTLENRQVVLYDWLNLVTLGWAVFADTGGVWREGERLSFDEFKSDVGAGIRFAPTRSVDPSIIRVDLAYALNDNDRSSRWVVNIGAEIVFGKQQPRKFDL